MTNYVAYTDGKAGAANSALSPVYLGWVNQQGGSADLAPEATRSAEITVEYINQHLGGIQGHPLKLVECAIPDTVAAASQCGEQMADNTKIHIVAAGPITIGNQPFESAVAPTHKPIVFGVSATEVDLTYKPAFLLFGDGLHLLGPTATMLVNVYHVKHVAILYENTPGSALIAQIVSNALKLYHVTSKIVGFDPSTTNLTEPLIAAGAATSDAIYANVVGDDCVNLNTALKQLNITKPVTVSVPCLTPAVLQGDGGTFPSWVYGVGSSLANDTSDPSGAAFAKVLALYGAQSEVTDTWYDTTFAEILTVARYLNEAGPTASSAQITAAAKAFKGPLVFGPPHLVCGEIKSAPAVCNDEVQYFTVANGKFKRIQSWVGPPAGLTVPVGGS